MNLHHDKLKHESARQHITRRAQIFERSSREDLHTRTEQQMSQVREYYRTLYQTWGRQHWWPGRSRFEVITGAVLVQNTAWRSVELALRALRSAGALSVAGMRALPSEKLEALIRPAGYFRQKARTLKNFIAFVDESYRGSLNRMFSVSTEGLRNELLSIRGIGPETADSILLYAGQHPVFVVDAYARRILDRHYVLDASMKYEDIRLMVEQALLPFADAHPEGPAEIDVGSHRSSAMSMTRRSPLAQVYNEMHGLLVAAGKRYCLKAAPRCEECPLQTFLPKRPG